MNAGSRRTWEANWRNQRAPPAASTRLAPSRRSAPRREEVAGPRHVDPEKGRDDLRAGPRVAVADHLEDQRACERLAPRPLLPRQGMAPDAVAAGHRLQLLQVEPHELDAGLRRPGGDEAGALEQRGDAAGVVVRAGRVGGRVEVRPDQQPRPSRVTPRHAAHNVVVRASPERERREIDAEAERAQLARDVVASGPMALGRGARVADAFERRDMTP